MSSTDPTTRQRIESALVDAVFLAIVAFLAFRRVISEAVLSGLLGTYASGRFGIKLGKQQALALARANGDGSTGGGPPSDPNGGGAKNGASRSGPWAARAASSSSPILALAAFVATRGGNHV